MKNWLFKITRFHQMNLELKLYNTYQCSVNNIDYEYIMKKNINSVAWTNFNLQKKEKTKENHASLIEILLFT